MASNITTMSEGLNKLLSEISQMMPLPDADLDFLTKLQMVITSFIRQPQQQPGNPQQSPNIPPAPPPAGMGSAPMAPGMAPGMGAANLGGMGGATPSVPTPNPDELRRVLSMGGQ